MQIQKFYYPLIILFLLGITSCTGHGKTDIKSMDMEKQVNKAELDSATFGAGCFWCVEAAFGMFKGVEKVESGYAGGHAITDGSDHQRATKRADAHRCQQ